MKLNNFLNIKGDMVVWMVFLMLCMISVLEVYSASSSMSYSTGRFWYPIMKHGIYVLVGIALAWIIHRIPCKMFKLISSILLFVSYLMLFYVLLAAKINDAARWINLGSITIQPSELAKLSLVGFVAFIAASARKDGHINALGMKIIISAFVLAVALIASENWSTAGLITCVIFFMLCFAKAPSKFLGWITAGGVGLMIAVATFLFSLDDKQLEAMRDNAILHRVPMVVNRIKGEELPADPKDYQITDKNRQVTHAQIAIATCNVIGKMPGNSVQRDHLPQAYSDFIYAIIIEEWGVEGAMFVMFLYLLLMWRALRIANKCSSLFPAYLVMGLALMIVMQAMMNMAVAVGAMPVTGQPLPLISKGGTSTFVSCVYIGMILSVSWSAKKKGDEMKELPLQVSNA
ncbi:MAG: FtsW/RodA/SpoVE family cell cycle protein [Bacteroidaceae bacterium]|nr:FtsW/RodA/SpoVE family cell cycle protein [Bacteroidaceae bacterium]